MNISSIQQAYTFLLSTAAGCLVGILFDVFRVFRKMTKWGDIATMLEDIIFWFVTCVFVFFVFFRLNSGEIRMYMIGGMLLGILLYSVSLSRLTRFILAHLFIFIRTITFGVIKAVVFPIYIIFKVLKKPLVIVMSPIRDIRRKLKKLLAQIKKMVIMDTKKLKKT